MSVSKAQLIEVKEKFEEITGLSNLSYEFKRTSGDDAIIIFVSSPSEILFQSLNEAVAEILGTGLDNLVATLKSTSRTDIVDSPEARLLQKLLSEGQTIHRHSFGTSFSERYISSVSGAEEQIFSRANHIVFGRRGAGKSMLLLFARNSREKQGLPSIWLDLQAYSNIDGAELIGDVLIDFIVELESKFGLSADLTKLIGVVENAAPDFQTYKKIAPKIRRIFKRLSAEKEIFLFLDDIHVLNRAMQSQVLDVMYSILRGSQGFFKISAIENLTRTYDPTSRVGLELPHDAQAIHLDYNLTTPEKTSAYIEQILDAYARSAGISNIRRMCSSSDVIPRLTWVSAGVPRDAIYLFTQAIQKAKIDNRYRVTVSNVNQAASEMLSLKFRDLSQDASNEAVALKSHLEAIKEFCIKEKRINAFLVEIDSNSENFDKTVSLVQLRFLHVISEGITPKEAGKKYIALILDYGLYIGIRAAQSVELFNKSFSDASYGKLRKLPIFTDAMI